jgi:hypothetical protein
MQTVPGILLLIVILRLEPRISSYVATDPRGKLEEDAKVIEPALSVTCRVTT